MSRSAPSPPRSQMVIRSDYGWDANDITNFKLKLDHGISINLFPKVEVLNDSLAIIRDFDKVYDISFSRSDIQTFISNIPCTIDIIRKQYVEFRGTFGQVVFTC